MKRVCFKTLVDEVQELEALSKDPGAVVHGKRYKGQLINLPASLDKNESKKPVKIKLQLCGGNLGKDECQEPEVASKH